MPRSTPTRTSRWDISRSPRQAAGQSTTYDNTPFSITYLAGQFDGNALTDPDTVTITGVLNGTVTGPNQSSVVATFNPLTNGSFQTVDNGNWSRAR